MRSTRFLGVACWISAASAAFDLHRGGGVLKAPYEDHFVTVTGTFNVPTLSGTNRLSIWVGIGDNLDQNYVLGGGIVYNSTLKSFSVYWPGTSIDTTTAVPVSNGNSITAAINTAAAGGTVTVENKTQNKKTTQSLSAPLGVDPAKLTALAASWFVQAYQITPGQLVQTPNFGTVAFTSCSATTKSGKSVPISSAGRYEIQGTSGQMYSATTILTTGISVKRQT
ncbi:concanavalin A-like lectin/glucanase domain-containing protein [Phaeosphaeriaceae sp. PMI808]|nr:concanavalin A-like lectin/glucanase domain-containing protein [Phaeosphaeriaceae sp. PMI808]